MYGKWTDKALIQQIRANIAQRPASNTQALNEICGRFRFTDGPNGTIVIRDQGWVAENIVGLTTQAGADGGRPDLSNWPATPTLRNGKPAWVTVPRVWVHRRAAPSLVMAWRELNRRDLARSIRSFDGLWVPRYILNTPGNPLSVHSWAMAIDLEARWNGFGARPTINETAARVFEFYGFSWGGRWRGPGGASDFSRCDAMHFEFCDPLPGAMRSPAQDGVTRT